MFVKVSDFSDNNISKDNPKHNVIDRLNSSQILKDFLGISFEKTGMSKEFNIDSLSEIMLANLTTSGFFDDQGNFKSYSETSTIIINEIENVEIRKAISEISDMEYSNDLFSNIRTRLMSIQRLTIEENDLLDGYTGVYEGSYEIWDSFTPEQQKKIYSDLDSKGYLYGWNKGLPLIGVPGVGHGARLALAASYSAYFSYTATRM